MIIETVKAAVYIFPFIKELFLGKDKKEGEPGQSAPDPKKGRFLRQCLITLAIISVLLNSFLVEKVFTMGSTIVQLKREVTGLRPNPTAAGRDMVLLPGQAPAPPPPKVEAIVTENSDDGPPVPLVPEAKKVDAAPPRDEHVQAQRPARQNKSSRHVADPPAERPGPSHYDRLRRIDEIR